jgi:hypothetical protein
MDVGVDGFGEGGDVEKKQLQSLSPDFFRLTKILLGDDMQKREEMDRAMFLKP